MNPPFHTNPGASTITSRFFCGRTVTKKLPAGGSLNWSDIRRIPVRWRRGSPFRRLEQRQIAGCVSGRASWPPLGSAAAPKHAALLTTRRTSPIVPSPYLTSTPALPNGGVGRTCRTLRGVRPPAHLLQFLPQPSLPEVPGRRGQGVAGRPPGRTAARALFPYCLHPAETDRRHGLSQQGGRL